MATPSNVPFPQLSVGIGDRLGLCPGSQPVPGLPRPPAAHRAMDSRSTNRRCQHGPIITSVALHVQHKRCTTKNSALLPEMTIHAHLTTSVPRGRSKPIREVISAVPAHPAHRYPNDGPSGSSGMTASRSTATVAGSQPATVHHARSDRRPARCRIAMAVIVRNRCRTCSVVAGHEGDRLYRIW